MSSEKISRREFLQFLAFGAAGLIGIGMLGNYSTRLASAHPPIAKPFPSQISNGDFEDGLRGWNIGPTLPNNAFENQPVRGTSITAAEVDPRMVPIGGDYWRNTRYHVGSSGNFLIKSIPGRSGLLWSSPFMIPKLTEGVSFLIGGGLGRVRLQRLVTDDVEVYAETGESSVLHAGTWIDSSETVTANPSASLIMEERMIGLNQNQNDVGKVMRVVVETFRNSITPLLVDNFRIQIGSVGGDARP